MADVFRYRSSSTPKQHRIQQISLSPVVEAGYSVMSPQPHTGRKRMNAKTDSGDGSSNYDRWTSEVVAPAEAAFQSSGELYLDHSLELLNAPWLHNPYSVNRHTLVTYGRMLVQEKVFRMPKSSLGRWIPFADRFGSMEDFVSAAHMNCHQLDVKLSIDTLEWLWWGNSGSPTSDLPGEMSLEEAITSLPVGSKERKCMTEIFVCRFHRAPGTESVLRYELRRGHARSSSAAF
ncbi:hypothetical protein OF83DRAFT_511504 [Amylostereum chailletii]|nr:hypothetical protein OF83DRAFT_511504 [Amylostereum chailletii]